MKTLFQCGWIVSCDPVVGTLRHAEMLIEDDQIVAVGRNLGAAADKTVDASDMIVMPGLVNAHMHTFQAGLRGIGGNWILSDYFRYVYGNMSTLYRPEDNYIGTLIGALNQIDNGVTTLFDYCHNITSTEQAERSIDALEESGIRALYGLGSGPLPPALEKAATVPSSARRYPRDRLDHFRKGRLSDDSRLVTLALALPGPHWSTWEASLANFELAAEYDLISSSHATKRPADALAPDGYRMLAERGLVGPRHNIVHGNFLEDEELRRLVDLGVTFTSTVQTEFRGYASDPVVGRVRAFGGLPSLGVDVEPKVSGDMFREMQLALINVLADATRSDARGNAPPRTEPAVRMEDALAWGTMGGAAALGLADRVGSLTPGKQADIVMLRSTDLNLFPVNDAVTTIVEMANGRSVDTVLIAGKYRKRDGKLLYPVEQLRARQQDLLASVAWLMEQGNFRVAA
ncbi:amidohydrolase family protein [soil metagenome]